MNTTYLNYLKQHKGFAIVSVLLMLGLITVMLVAFLGLMRGDRISSQSYAQSVKAEQLGLGALDLIVKELRAEMGKAVSPSVEGNYPVYTNITKSNIMPEEIGLVSVQPPAIPKQPVTLLKRSFSDGMFSAGNLQSSTLDSSVINSSAPSVNGRFISNERWNKAFLGKFTDNDNTPNWIIMTRQGPDKSGPLDNSVNSLNNPLSPRYALGRFAYAIYDVGGLIDVNIAGYPSDLSAADISELKGTLAGFDLAKVSGLSEVTSDLIINWRNFGSQNELSHPYYDKYKDQILKEALPSGFLNVFAGDNTFLGRQDLIKFAQSRGFESSLPSMTTFSRALNSPSWGPTTNAPLSPRALNDTNKYAYLTDKDDSTSANRYLPLVRASAGIIRADGTISESGEPLLKTRFPLSRLKGLKFDGIDSSINSTMISGLASPADAITIRRDFGLVWDNINFRWIYVGSTGNALLRTIKTLGQVAAENPAREANFFELLKAGILSGSLGLRSEKINMAIVQRNELSVRDPQNPQDHQDPHIIQIGANIIDQYDTDDFPTTITFACPDFTPIFGVPNWSYTVSGSSSHDIYGIENLPYLSEMRFRPFRTGGALQNFNGLLTVELWNPHLNAASPSVANNVPAVRILVTTNTLNPPCVTTSKSNVGPFITPIDRIANSTTIDVRNVGGFNYSNPTVISPAQLVATSRPENSVSAIGTAPAQVGFYLGYSPIPLNPSDRHGWSKVHFGSGYIIELQFLSNLVYRTYQRFARVGEGFADEIGTTNLPGANDEYTSESYNLVLARVDPRGNRLGFSAVDTSGLGSGSSIGMGLSDNPTSLNFTRTKVFTPQGGLFSPGGFNNFRFQDNPTGIRAPHHAHNTGAGNRDNPNYKDRDGVQRRGDADQTNNIHPLHTGKVADRPVMLNRAFKSVAELGYAYRDQPFKTLDMFSFDSADAGLLDIFCLTEQGKSNMVAGQINLNTRNSQVIESLLVGSHRKYDNTTPISASVAATIAGDYIDTTIRPNILNRSELVTVFRATTGGNNPSFTVSSAYPALKMEREAVVRSLMDMGQTRTWNLMIDVIAQSGRYPSVGSTTLDKFIVEGERRYWVHLAIDRLTGKIVDQKLEPVIE